MSGIRTNAAAELLGVSPSTLRGWERRFGYPQPRRTAGGHRHYELVELETLRRALRETHNISSAIEAARQRREGPSSPSRLLDAFDHFDEAQADRVMEESLAVRSVDRSVEEVLLPAVALAESRDGREAEWELGCRWATGWLYAARRVVPGPSRAQGVLFFDSSKRLSHESLNVQALELAVRRAGFRTLPLSFELPPERVVRAVRAVEPAAFVFCGDQATLEVLGRLVYTARQVQAGAVSRIFEYRGAMPVSGDQTIPSLGTTPTEAANRLKQYMDTGRFEKVMVMSEDGGERKRRAGSAAVRDSGSPLPPRRRHGAHRAGA